MSRVTERIRSINKRGKKALIPYLPGGYPQEDTFWDVIKELDDPDTGVIEIGVPFSDPVADGPVVEAASLQCLENGMTLARLLEETRRHKQNFETPLLFMGYYNSFLHYGLDHFAQDAASAGLSAAIIPDLPLEESHEARRALNAFDLDLIPLVGLNTPKERLKKYAEVEQGFLYFVSVLGTTGVRETFPPELQDALMRVREYFSIPVALGFGITTRTQVEEFGDLIDAGVIGSALIRNIAEGRGARL
ncbi:MAG: tryptophan synthase subunit alpha [Synergistaceae bacterium]|jgi:tryptophan synthase alpha chain|nr:tryptophan synthase subunit alpha [Synergistaceae bacterium]